MSENASYSIQRMHMHELADHQEAACQRDDDGGEWADPLRLL